MRQMLVAAALTTSLLTPGAQFGGLWNLLSSLWNGSAGTDAGCIMDPSGRCQPAPQIDAGCIMDPYGRCQPASQLEEGCIMDPDGRCRPAQQIEEGCIMDPSGQCRPASS